MVEELNEDEATFIRAFIRPERQETFLTQMASSQWRRRFLDRLNHRFLDDLVPECVRKSHDCSGIVLANPETSCFVIADEEAYDGKSVSVKDAFKLLGTAYFGIVVLLLPGKLACYRDEVPFTRKVWLVRDE
jgi:hypothetical protein